MTNYNHIHITKCLLPIRTTCKSIPMLLISLFDRFCYCRTYKANKSFVTKGESFISFTNSAFSCMYSVQCM